MSTRELNRLESALESGEIDGKELRKISKILVEEEYNVSDGITLTDILSIKQDNGDIVKMRAVVESSDGEVVWLEEGSLDSETKQAQEWIRDDGGSGWIHIQHNHINTPNGNEFLKYGVEYEDTEEVQRLVFSAIEDGNRIEIDGDIWYGYRVPGTDEKYISVLVGFHGYTVTALRTKMTE